MDQRKLIGFGSSLVVSLPKDWTEKHGLKKGHTIICEEENGKIIFKSSNEVQEQRHVSIDVSRKSNSIIRAEIVSSYICDYNTIEINNASDDNAEYIRDVIKDLTGMEIIDATRDKIIAKDFLDLQNISIESFLKTMDSLTRAMIVDAMKIDEKNYDSLVRRDKDLNRIFWLIIRVINHFSICPSEKYSVQDLLFYKKVVENLEILADQQKRIARVIEEENFSKKAKNAVSHYFNFILADYDLIMKAVYEKDKSVAFKIETSVDFYKKLADKTYEECKDEGVIEFLKRSRSSIRGMARAVLNYLLDVSTT